MPFPWPVALVGALALFGLSQRDEAEEHRAPNLPPDGSTPTPAPAPAAPGMQVVPLADALAAMAGRGATATTGPVVPGATAPSTTSAPQARPAARPAPRAYDPSRGGSSPAQVQAAFALAEYLRSGGRDRLRIRQAQSAMGGLSADGIVGNNTRARMAWLLTQSPQAAAAAAAAQQQQPVRTWAGPVDQ